MNIYFDARFGAWRRCATLLVAAALSISTAAHAACTADTSNSIGGGTLVYEGDFEIGDAIVDWSVGRAVYMTGCDLDQKVDLSIKAPGRYYATLDGYDTFYTDNDNIGVQFMYRYPTRVNSVGAPIYSAWNKLGQTAETFTAALEYVSTVWTSNLQLEYRIRFVALRTFSGEQETGQVVPAELADLTLGMFLHQKTWERYYLEPARDASCWFAGGESQNVELPMTSTMMLRNEGDTGPAKDFSWRFRCDYGNLGQEPAMGIEYTAGTTATVADQGRMSVTGGAQGVDLQVRRWNGSAMVPVTLRSRAWVRWDEESGTEQLDVRYIRNADPLVPGEANGSLKIYIEPW